MSDATRTARPATELPGSAVPYVQDAGSGRAHLLLGQVGRTLVGAEESDGRMSVMTCTGPAGRAIPLHFHEGELEVFLCTHGRVQVYAGDESRILTPGDLAVVPPGTLHAFQFHAAYSQFMGPITPGGWDRFFDLTGTPWPTAAFPPVDPSPPPFEKFGRAEVEFKMKYRPDLPYPEATADAPDDTLPGTAQPYFLRAGEGPRHLLGGQLATTLVTAAESGGQLGTATIQGPAGSAFPTHVHERTHESLYVLDGRVRLWLDGEAHLLTAGDCASIPPGIPHAYAFEGHVTRVATMNAPAGIEALFAVAGEPYEHRIFPPEAEPLPGTGALAERLGDLDVAFVDA
jgi:quercetin dioxygenase-like cupin family protein